MFFHEIIEARYPRQATADALTKAEELNFDVSKLWYHGTRRRFDGFRLPKETGIDELGPGVYLTSKQWLANTWARKGGFILICVIRNGPLFDLAQEKNPETMTILKQGYRQAAITQWGTQFAMKPEDIDDTFEYAWRDSRDRRRLLNNCLSGAGYIGAYESQIQGQVVVFKPDDVMIVARRGGEEHMRTFD
jgi:hypothetical protein